MQNRNRLTDIDNELMVTKGESRGRDKFGIWDYQISHSVQLLSCILLFATPWTAACQASLSFTISWSLLKIMFIESVMPSNHLILCRLLLLPLIFPSIRVFSNESVLRIRWPKYWSYRLLYKINNNNIRLYSTRNYIQYLKITYNEKESEKESICAFIYMKHFAVLLKHHKSTRL